MAVSRRKREKLRRDVPVAWAWMCIGAVALSAELLRPFGKVTVDENCNLRGDGWSFDGVALTFDEDA